MPSWFVLLVAVWGIVVSAMAVSDLRKARQLKQARDWPIAEARVINIHQTPDENRFPSVTLGYTYKVDDERYGGSESLVFAKAEDAARFEEAYREGTVFHVHYRPDKPEVSVLARDDRIIGEKSPLY